MPAKNISEGLQTEVSFKEPGPELGNEHTGTDTSGLIVTLLLFYAGWRGSQAVRGCIQSIQELLSNSLQTSAASAATRAGTAHFPAILDMPLADTNFELTEDEKRQFRTFVNEIQQVLSEQGSIDRQTVYRLLVKHCKSAVRRWYDNNPHITQEDKEISLDVLHENYYASAAISDIAGFAGYFYTGIQHFFGKQNPENKSSQDLTLFVPCEEKQYDLRSNKVFKNFFSDAVNSSVSQRYLECSVSELLGLGGYAIGSHSFVNTASFIAQQKQSDGSYDSLIANEVIALFLSDRRDTPVYSVKNSTESYICLDSTMSEGSLKGALSSRGFSPSTLIDSMSQVFSILMELDEAEDLVEYFADNRFSYLHTHYFGSLVLDYLDMETYLQIRPMNYSLVETYLLDIMLDSMSDQSRKDFLSDSALQKVNFKIKKNSAIESEDTKLIRMMLLKHMDIALLKKNLSNYFSSMIRAGDTYFGVQNSTKEE